MVYVLHLTRPLGKSLHYTGWAKNEVTLNARLDHHRNGRGATFTRVCAERGIDWVVAVVFPNADRRFERSLKDRHDAKRYCPICRKLKQEKT